MADLFAKITCTYCQEEINGVRIQCCECPDFDICLQCFAVGAEIGPHKNDHSYKFVDHCAVSIFGGRGAWTGREHLRLLDAAELYSYGNWELIAKHVETRTAEECREEYCARYLDGNIGRATWGSFPKPNLIIDLAEDDGPLSPAALAKLAPLDATPEEARVLGYKPHRDDFEREYNQEAEKLVAELQLEEHDETDIERALKLAIVDMYIRRLRERQRRKRIVRDYQLVAKYFDNLRRDPSQPQYPKAQQELRDNMRPFAQFLNSGEQERLIASIERERELRNRLSELMRYRSLGLTTQEEIVHYEQHVAFQRMQIRQGKAAGRGENRTRLYQFAFHLGQQWLCDASGPPSLLNIRKRRRRNKLKFHRRKNHVAVRKRFRVRQRGGGGGIRRNETERQHYMDAADGNVIGPVVE